MSSLANLAVGLVALLHVYFLFLEMFFWDKPLGMRLLNLTPEFAKATKELAANQGLYNGFLAAGLIWGLMLDTAGGPIKVFCLCCVVVAGTYGGCTVNPRILWVQAVPALVALALVAFS